MTKTLKNSKEWQTDVIFKVQTAFGECVTHKKFEQSFYKVCNLTRNTAR